MKFNKTQSEPVVNAGPMLNAYPDSLGSALSQFAKFLREPDLNNVFSSFYILPSIFNTDLDRGFSVIDYNLNEQNVTKKDLQELKKIGITLKLDFVINHASVLSRQFRDIIKNGETSEFRDFFIDWNKFWDGYGKMSAEGFIQPEPDYIKDMFFRKPGLPILKVPFPDGKQIPYWNTFYQEVKYEKVDAHDLIESFEIQYASAIKLSRIINSAISRGKRPSEIELGRFEQFRSQITMLLESGRKYLGQMDLNIRSPLVWEYYSDTLKKLAGYGAQIIRLDAFAYASKIPGEKNFFNEPGTWDFLENIRDLALKYNLTLLPEIHSRYEDKIQEKLAHRGFLTYDFFLPGLILDALENHENVFLIRWIRDLLESNIRAVNMLGCHDGIPLLDLKGLMPEERIQNLIDLIVSRGGYVKDLHGNKKIYYQVNATYYSALGENDSKFLLARAIQIFMPGIPQVWYLDLFAGKNDHAAVKKAGPGGHKEINRTNLTMKEAMRRLNKPIVRKQIDLLRFRNNFPAFGFESQLKILDSECEKLKLRWERNGHIAILEASLKDYSFHINAIDNEGKPAFKFQA